MHNVDVLLLIMSPCKGSCAGSLTYTADPVLRRCWLCRLMCVGYGLRTLEVRPCSMQDMHAAYSLTVKQGRSCFHCSVVSTCSCNTLLAQVRFDMEQTMLLDERDFGVGSNYLPG